MESFASAMHEVAQGNVAYVVGVAALLGVAFHLSIRPIEFEFIMFHFMAASAFAFVLLVYVLGFVTAILFTATFNTAVLSSVAVYRLAFHRCRQFPGPLAAKVTRFYAASLSAKNVKYYKELANMHDQYGDFVRTGKELWWPLKLIVAENFVGPREISVLSKEAVPLLYGPNSETRKSTWYGQTGNDPKKCSIHMTRDFNDHRLRRRAWDRGFSIKGARTLKCHVTSYWQILALGTYEPRIKAKADLLNAQISKNAGNPMDVSAWSMFFSFDVMGEVGFGKDFNNLNSGIEHAAIKGVHSHMTMLGIMSTVPWLLNVLGSIPGAAAGYSDFFSFCAGQIREKHKVSASFLCPYFSATDIM
jgi:hypothetical protein